MFNDLMKYIVATAIIIGLFSFLYKKEGHTKGPVAVGRVIRLFSGAIGCLFLFVSIGITFFTVLGKNTQSNQEISIRLIIALFTFVLGVLFLIIAIFKKYPDRIAEEFIPSLTKKSIDFKQGIIEKVEIILWIISTICGLAAFKTYNLVFFILFFVFGFMIVILKIKKGKW